MGVVLLLPLQQVGALAVLAAPPAAVLTQRRWVPTGPTPALQCRSASGSKGVPPTLSACGKRKRHALRLRKLRRRLPSRLRLPRRPTLRPRTALQQLLLWLLLQLRVVMLAQFPLLLLMLLHHLCLLSLQLLQRRQRRQQRQLLPPL